MRPILERTVFELDAALTWSTMDIRMKKLKRLGDGNPQLSGPTIVLRLYVLDFSWAWSLDGKYFPINRHGAYGTPRSVFAMLCLVEKCILLEIYAGN